MRQFAGAHREPDIGPHRRGDDRHVPDIELVPDHAGGERELDDGRHRVEQREADDGLDAVGAALDDARQAAGAPVEMEAQRQAVQVHEGAVGELAHGVLADAGEQRVAQLVQPVEDDAAEIVAEHQHERRRQHERQVAWRLALAGQRVGRPFVGIGHQHRDDLGDQQRGKRQHDAALQVGAVRRPHIGPEVQHRRQRAPARRHLDRRVSHGQPPPYPYPSRREAASRRRSGRSPPGPRAAPRRPPD